jgi:hypothetical protein
MDEGAAGSVCFVTVDLAYLPGYRHLGGYYWVKAHLLAQHGFRVHLLYGNEAPPDRAAASRVRQLLTTAGIGFSALTDFPRPPYFDLPTYGSNPLLQRSDRIRHVLEHLHARHHFDLIEFIDYGATGFRTVQARRTGLAFGDVRLLVHLMGCGQWERETHHRWPTSKEDLRNDFAERYAFDHADLQASGCREKLEYARGIGWQVRDDARLIPRSFQELAFVSLETEQSAESINREVVEEYRQMVACPSLLVTAGSGAVAKPLGDALRKPARTTPTLLPGIAKAGRASNGFASPVVPLVSVVVTHYNLGDYLPEALASLAAQTYAHLDVIVIDDGSTDPGAQTVWQEQQRVYPQFRFLRQDNKGCGAARNRGLAEARGEYVIFLDADNIACPEMVTTFVRGLQRNPEVAALTCHVLGFRQEKASPRRHWVFRNAFAGGPHVLACLENVYGDTTAIFRTADLRAAGGYETDRSTPWEDWLTYIKLVHAGYQVDAIPACLLLYRVRADSRTARMNQGRFDEDRHAQHLVRKYFSGALPPPGVDAASLWPVLVGFARLSDQQATMRHRLVERLNGYLRKLPWLHRGLKTLATMMAWLPRLLT